jgi:hypothetical protein
MGSSISLRLAAGLCTCNFIREIQMLVVTITFHLLWTGRGSALRSVDWLGFCELKYTEQHGDNNSWAARYDTCACFVTSVSKN